VSQAVLDLLKKLDLQYPVLEPGKLRELRTLRNRLTK
jgi:hypothetical protein